jgi:hypothetical protein
MFGNRLLAGLADPRHCPHAGAECPLRVTTRPGIRRLRSPQSVRMRGVRLRFEPRWMAAIAGRTSDVVRTGILSGCGPDRTGHE